MKIKYKASYMGITPVEVIKETEKTITIKSQGSGPGYRANKESWALGSISYHDTWEEAHKRLVDDAAARVESLRTQLERAKGHLGNVKGMKKPVDPTPTENKEGM